MKTSLEFILNKIRDPQNWTQNSLARNAEGERTTPDSPDAVCWCLFGAYLLSPDRHSEDFEFLQIFLDEFDTPVGPFNDTHTHSEIINWLEKKIESMS